LKPIHYFFLGTGSWFLAYGLQSVIFAWLVTMVLNESAAMVGVAQMAFLAPAMFLMLLGGSLADHFGGRRLALAGHALAAFAPLFLCIATLLGDLSYSLVIVFAVILGCAQSLVTPARDGLVAVVAGGRIQRVVVQASMIQFGIQMCGLLIASKADQVGASVMLFLQFSILAAGCVTYYLMKVERHERREVDAHIFRHMAVSIYEGFLTVRASPSMRIVVAQNCAVGIFFMGSYIVSMPLLIRDIYAGSSAELSYINTANAFGLVITIFILLRLGDVYRQGRAMLIAHGLGCLFLGSMGMGFSFEMVVGLAFCWGLCGGIGMTMSRTIMQEGAPPDQRARMMAFYSFSFMGAGPVGALFNGFLVDWFDPGTALMISSGLMLVSVTTIRLTAGLWHVDSRDGPAEVLSEVR
jgi:MFS family permease